MHSRREEDLKQIDRIREELGVQTKDLSAYPKAKREIKQSGLSQEETDPYLQDIRGEQSALITKKQELRDKLKGLEGDVASIDVETGSQPTEADNNKAFETPAIDPNSEAMGQIQEEAFADAAKFDKNKEALEKAELIEKYQTKLKELEERLPKYKEKFQKASNQVETRDLAENISEYIINLDPSSTTISNLNEEDQKAYKVWRKIVHDNPVL